MRKRAMGGSARVSRAWVGVAATVLVALVPGAVAAQAEAAPEALRRMAPMLGEWESERVEFLDASGARWRTSSRQRMVRLRDRAQRHEQAPGQTRPPALAGLDDYVGLWRSDEKQTSDGRAFHFTYDLRWVDEARTLTHMRIRQIGPDGETVLFEGFKGLEPSGAQVYYVAASPAGRAARGFVVLDGADLVTDYDGWGPDGSLMRIRDVFSPPEEGGDAFESRTLLRRQPGEPWREVARDRWRRVSG